ncbi:hypothetical protein BASA50_009506 [Batrachochytrium salamandrivorans]|uniref:ACB domain-containing protein n=1 Tax=Batrachochytrium salamandrivorans TaxID=1357716 RepID=A0ABQ8F479_9FUNG|nr:hypothetical protein BASA62_009840 [Batrachochytrium salamandrivorans]KAH6565153.1 hypothetical protein BASA60_010029 [Batrachochytrium salamandrivorans]KAH6590245.1 hypothetical protein BASA50_009506 [Batrachochytrium salamandrivorans]KAH9251307.1 hypothetical protein BASA81_010865 [Batrachochytrium salamandrivorans]KAH9275177.1 hypothetical protein BASA83_002402 [Batrachochytrium salamandrivorans]
MDELQEAFIEAVAQIQAYKGPSFQTTSLLKLYALFKVATLGQCTIARPGIFDFQGRAKWDAWNDISDMPQSLAKLQYVSLVEELLNLRSETGDALSDSNRHTNSAVLATGFRVSSMNNSRETISDADKTIFEWAEEGSVPHVNEMLQAGICINVRDKEGMSLLHWAADRDYLDLAKLLLEHGIQVNAQDNTGLTPLHYALIVESRQMVDLLVHTGHARTDIADKEGETPLDMASVDLLPVLQTSITPASNVS